MAETGNTITFKKMMNFLKNGSGQYDSISYYTPKESVEWTNAESVEMADGTTLNDFLQDVIDERLPLNCTSIEFNKKRSQLTLYKGSHRKIVTINMDVD